LLSAPVLNRMACGGTRLALGWSSRLHPAAALHPGSRSPRPKSEARRFVTYKAFISYSHAIDDRLAPALQASLQRFAKPWNQLRAMRVFVDKASLSANPGLWSTIEAALADSEYFILLASPSSAQSFWVQKEVETWLQLGRANRLLIVLTGGEIRWSLQDRAVDAAATTALPGVLQGVLQEEPLYTDLQWVRQEEHLSLQDPRFTDAVAGLAATIRGVSKEDLYGEQVTQLARTIAGPQWPAATVEAFDARIASACPGGTAVASR
jgi:TIR domain